VVSGASASPPRRTAALFGLGGYSGPLTARISFCGAPARSYGALGVDRYHVLRQAEDP